jgi:hypothetical protein
VTFAADLDHLIRKHVDNPKYGDEMLPIIEALYEAAGRMATQADRYRWCDESQRQFEGRRRWQAADVGKHLGPFLRSGCAPTTRE